MQFNPKIDDYLKSVVTDRLYSTPPPEDKQTVRPQLPPDDDALAWATKPNRAWLACMEPGLDTAIVFFADGIAPVAWFLVLTRFSCGMLLKADVLTFDLDRGTADIQLKTPMQSASSARLLASFHEKVQDGSEFLAVKFACRWHLGLETWLRADLTDASYKFAMSEDNACHDLAGVKPKPKPKAKPKPKSKAKAKAKASSTPAGKRKKRVELSEDDKAYLVQMKRDENAMFEDDKAEDVVSAIVRADESALDDSIAKKIKAAKEKTSGGGGRRDIDVTLDLDIDPRDLQDKLACSRIAGLGWPSIFCFYF